MNKLLSFVLLTLLVFTLGARNINKIVVYDDNIDNFTISFGEAFSYKLDENVSWKIVDSKSFSVINTGIGPIDKVVFSTPGNYQIELSEVISADEKQCQHGHFPHKIVIEVSPLKMIFDFNTIKFNNEIVGGQAQYGNEISIDVYVESYNNENVYFNNGKVTSAGIGVNIEGNIKTDGSALKKGINHLVYKLNGEATSKTYIMFDFYDINNQIISYSYPNIIK